MKAIVNRFAGKCNTCTETVPAGAGVAVKNTTRWIVLCGSHKPETHGATNPWRNQHMAAEMDFTGGEYTRAMGRRAVDSEYRNTDEMSEPCECGGTFYWRATVGARQCPDCRAMAVYRWDESTKTMIRKVIK